MNDTAAAKTPVPVWDLPTRLFHWTLAALVIACLTTGQLGPMRLHQLFGLCVLALVLFRLVWGIVGGTHARFADFVKGPGALLDYLKRQPVCVGHNPLGGLMVLGLLALLLLQASLGLFGNDDISYEAPLSKFVSKDASDAATGYHGLLFKLLLAMVLLHVSAVFFYLVAKKDNLIIAMITGVKELPADMARHKAKMGNALLALVILAATGALTYGLLLL